MFEMIAPIAADELTCRKTATGFVVAVGCESMLAFPFAIYPRGRASRLAGRAMQCLSGLTGDAFRTEITRIRAALA
jgi:hypothetical protein